MTMTLVNDIMDNTKILQLITERMENVSLKKPVDNWEMNQVDLFEIELRKHAIIEDHVLVPMVVALENKLKV